MVSALQDDDLESDFFVLAIGQAPTFRIAVGGQRGQTARVLQSPQWPAFFVPQRELKGMDVLRAILRQ
jgi:hypothetical protein